MGKYLEGIMLSKISQRKTNNDIIYMLNLKITQTSAYNRKEIDLQKTN